MLTIAQDSCLADQMEAANADNLFVVGFDLV